jgi:O-antigen/teichoic acid export membrane protein
LADIGIYSICFTIGYTLIQIIVNPIWSLFPTKAAELYNLNKVKEINNLFNQSIKLICWLILPSILGFVIIGDQLLKILSTNEFASGYLVIPIILLGYLFLMLSAYFETILSLKNKPHFSTIFTVLACIVNLALNFILIPKFSYMGAAIATTLSFGTQLLMTSIYALREELVTLDKKSLVRITLSALGMFLVTCFAKIYLFNFDTLSSFLCLMVVGIFVHLFLTTALNIYNIKHILSFFKRDFIHV